MDEKIRIMVDAAILMENSFDGQQVCASDLLPLARVAAPLAREVERLTAECAALLAPVEGVDLDEVLRLDREGTPAARWTVDTGEWREGDRYVRQVVVNQYEEVTKEYDFADFPARSAELEAALAPIKTDEALITFYRTAAPALAREVIQLRAAVRLADEEGAKAIDRVSRTIVADKWNSTAQLQEEVKRLTAELEEARLTLAAEQGRAEGAPSEGWVFEDGWRRIDAVADRYVCLIDDSDPMSRWCATVITGPEDAAIERETWAPNARAAMLAADTAHPATPETDRPSTPPASPE